MEEKYILRIHIQHSQPIEVSDFTKTMNGISGLFTSFAQKNGKSKEETHAKLFVSKIHEGSIDIHLLEMATIGLIPFVENSNLIMDFAKHIKSIYDYYVKGEPSRPELSVPDLKNIHDLVSVPSNDRKGTMSIQVINGNVENIVYSGCTFNNTDGNSSQNQVDKELEQMKAIQSSDNIWEKQLMTIFQVRKDGTPAGNKGVIDAISTKRLGLLFDSDELEEKILHSEDNPMRKAYYVDVMILTANGKPAAYKIMALHDMIDLD